VSSPSPCHAGHSLMVLRNNRSLGMYDLRFPSKTPYLTFEGHVNSFTADIGLDVWRDDFVAAGRLHPIPLPLLIPIADSLNSSQPAKTLGSASGPCAPVQRSCLLPTPSHQTRPPLHTSPAGPLPLPHPSCAPSRSRSKPSPSPARTVSGDIADEMMEGRGGSWKERTVGGRVREDQCCGWEMGRGWNALL
jgi:hypothetical protein